MKQISEAFSRRLQNEEITRIQWIALYYLKTKGKISQRDLSNLMNVADSSAGRLLDRLERDGFIKRERDVEDRRVTYITLTKEGDRLICELMPIGDEFINDLMKGISEEELRTYEKVLKKMISNVAE